MATYPDKYSEYFALLKTNYQTAVKLEWVNNDGTAYGEITNDYVDMSGSLSVGMENGTRRTADIELDNSDGKFTVDAYNLWYGRMVKLWVGLYLSDGTPYYFPQGVFYVNTVEEVNSPASRTITLHLVDKWCFLDGTMWGNLDGIYIVPNGSNIYESLTKLLKTSRFTGENVDEKGEPQINAVDPIKPNLASYYVTKEYEDNGTVWKAINTPYEIRMEYGKTYADILLEYATILGAYIYYDVDGRLTIEPTQDDIIDSSKPILWTFTPTEQEMLSEDAIHDFGTFYNDIIVIGYTTNGKQAKGRAQNKNTSSPTAIQVVGIKTYPPYEDVAYYTDDQCNELAQYYLKRQTIKQRSVVISSAPMFHLRENRLIECIRPYTTDKDVLLISGIELPIGTTGTMSITATSVNEFTFS